MDFTTLASWPLMIWKTLDEAGHDPRPVFESAGADPALLQQAGARYPVSCLRQIWNEAARIYAAPCFGIAAARHWHPTTMHALGIAWFASPSLHEAFQRFVRHGTLVSTGITSKLERGRGSYVYTVQLADSRYVPPAEGMHAAVAVIVRMCRMSLSEGFAPRRVTLPEATTTCHAALAEHLGCPVEIAGEVITLEMASADLQRQLPTANVELLASADRMIADYLAALDRDDVVARARAELLRQLPSGRVTEESVATALHVSLRTFQRRLRESGSNYRDLLQEVRRDLALKYIANPRLSITEISYLLGFSEPSSFARTFRRWTGCSPSQQRESQQTG